MRVLFNILILLGLCSCTIGNYPEHDRGKPESYREPYEFVYQLNPITDSVGLVLCSVRLRVSLIEVSNGYSNGPEILNYYERVVTVVVTRQYDCKSMHKVCNQSDIQLTIDYLSKKLRCDE